MLNLLHIAFARLGYAGSVVTTASVVVTVCAASICVVVVRLIIARVGLVVSGPSRIVWCGVIGGLIVITCDCRFAAVTGDVIDPVPIGGLELEHFVDGALAAIWAGSGAEHFLRTTAFAWTWSVEHDVAGARFRVVAAAPFAHATMMIA